MTQTIMTARRSCVRKALMMSCASAALAAAALFPQAARAQAFQGSISSSTGSVTRSMPTSTTETLTIGTNTATINWSPNNQQQGGGPIDFLPNGNTATFTSTQGVTDYTVLNRILPDSGQAIALNGHVISTLQGTSATGGHVWFYAPGGIVVGATAVFDVGSLLLTTNDVTSFGTTATGFNASFSGPAGSTSSIQIQNGAQINALQQNSYVALVAPRIEQGGTVRVNGSAAYAAGEQLSLTMNQGLFDIQVDVGTNDSQGIVHTGETSGPANTAATDNHTIYMVAVPKNQALTMLLSGGRIGFGDAVSAQVQNGQIILSSGQGVSGTTFDNQALGGAIGGPPSSITISGGHYASSVTARATGDLQADGGGGVLTFDGNASLQALQSARLEAHDGDTITIGGNLTLSSDDLRFFVGNHESDQVDAQGGDAALLSESGGSISVAGSAAVTANASPTVNVATNYGGTSQGGTATVDSDGGPISIGGNLTVSATAFGDGVSSPGIDGRDSFGGDANIFATGSALHVGGNVDIRAEGDGSSSALASGGTGGVGHGGTVDISADDNGSITVDGTTQASASGIGGTLLTSTDGTGGEGDAGHVTVAMRFGGSITMGGDATFFANGIAQTSIAQAGDGHGGSVALDIDGGSILGNGALTLFADGVGGTGENAGAGFGGDAFAGITGGEGTGDGGTLHVAGDFRVQAAGHGGVGADNAQGAGGQGGDGYAGTASFFVSPDQDSGATISVQLANVFVATNGEGGSGGNGVTGGNGGSGFGYENLGDGEGGFFSGSASADLFAGNVTTNQLQVFSTARGGNGGSGSNGAGGAGGDAFGGTSELTVGGTLTADVALSYDRAHAGNGGTGSTQGNGGQAQGGDASIDVIQGGNLNGAVDISTNAFGGQGDTGGDATGGFSTLSVEGTLTAPTISIAAAGLGGAGVTQGGNGDGGSATFEIFGGTANVTNTATIDVSSIGGNASNGPGGSAGLGNEGFAELETADGGSLTGGNLTIDADATGGNGLTAGAAQGGEIDLLADTFGTDAATSMTLQQLSLSANATTGSGAPPDETTSGGGFVSMSAFGGTLTADSLSVRANGSNTGGELTLDADSDGSGHIGNMHFGSVDAQANGGDFGGFIFASTASGSSIDLGDATLGTSGGFGGSIFLFAGGCAECGSSDSETTLQDAALPAGGGIAANNLTLNTTGNIFVELSGGADVSVSGTLNGTAGQIISLLDDGTGGAIRAHEIDLTAITIDDSADIIADIIRFTTPGVMTLGNLSATDIIDLTAGGDLTTGDLTAGEIHLESNGNIVFGNLTGDHTDFRSDGSVTGGNISVTNRASGDADGPIVLGNITAGPDLPTGNDFSVGMASGTSITVGNVTGAGHVGFATLGDLTTGNLTAGDLVMLLVHGDINTGSITTSASGRVYIADSSMFITGGGTGGGDNNDNFDPNVVLALAPVRTGGSIEIGGPVSTGQMQAAAGGDFTTGDITAPNGLTLDSGGNIATGNLSAQSVVLTADADTSVGDVDAPGSASFTAGGLASFTGDVSSPTITVTSSDIDIAEGASLGVSGVTNLLTLNAVSHGLPILIGDNGSSDGGASGAGGAGGASGQFQLNEQGEIRASSVVINAQGAVAGFNPDVDVFDVRIEGSNTSSVTLNTGGSVFVDGKVDFIDATPTDSLTINAGHAIEVNTDTGGIEMTDSTGALTGTLNLSADNIWVASGSVLGQLETDVNFAGRDTALGTNSGTANPDGFVRAGTINAGVADSLLVQNSGTPDLFAGIDTGAGGLSITNTGTTPAILIVFGRQTTGTGTVITNQDFLGTVGLTGTGGFTTDSSVNGCTIGGTCGEAPTTPGIDMASILGPLDDTNSPSDEDKKKKDKEGESDDGSSADPSLRLINTTPINNAPPITEPVTSGGDVIVGGNVQPN